MGPTAEAKTVASLFGLKRDAFGFFSSPLPNVFVSGTCQEPLSIPDSMATARAIALAMGKMQPGNGGHLSGQTVMNRPPNKTQADPQSIRPVQKAIKVLPEATSFDTRKVLLQQRVLVIGGGMAGITTAQELHCFGYPIAVIEQTEEIGDSGKMDGVEVFSRSSLLELTGNIGNFSVRIKTSEGDKTIPCGAVVLASGSRVPETVSTSSQMFAIADIEMALADLVKRRGIRAIGLILDLEIDETKASTEMALQLAKRIQQMQRYQTYLFCRDVRVAAKDLELLYDEARDAGVNIIKYAGKLSLSETEKGICITYTDSILNQTMTVYCDRIGISPCGISVSADAHLASITGVSTDGYGQFQDNNIHLFAEHTNRPGIFVVGSCRGQHYIPQILAEARATALEIHALLSPKYLEVELSNAVVDPDKCVLCLTCIRSCPHKAMQINRTQGAAESLPEVCQKCGICAGECPAKAIELPVYSDCVILKQVTE
jgi:heterodisulfide reductase subunit A-like polyferredoxin